MLNKGRMEEPQFLLAHQMTFFFFFPCYQNMSNSSAGNLGSILKCTNVHLQPKEEILHHYNSGV